MAYLLTKHDKFHAHALLGFLCLINYAYRVLLFLVYHDMGLSVYNIFPHILLSLSSLQFNVPLKRTNKHLPIIWKEFRLHNIVFALRHFLITIGLIYLNSKYHDTIITIGIFVTMFLADIITYYYQDKDLNTTRNMPYESQNSIEIRNRMQKLYSKTQFGATIAGFMGHDINFIMAFVIQFSAFLMTLERKGKIESKTWHIMYTYSILAVRLLVLYEYYFMISHDKYIFALGVGVIIAHYLRVDIRYNKYLVWLLCVCIIQCYNYFGFKTIVISKELFIIYHLCIILDWINTVKRVS